MTTYGLTRQQRDALAFIGTYIDVHGISPTFVEIASAINLVSKSGAARVVEALTERGYIRHLPNRARSISLAESAPASLAAFTTADLFAEIDRRRLQYPAPFVANSERQYG